MVEFLNTHFIQNGHYDDLNIVSDGICNNNSNQYLDFDKFIESLFQNGYFSGDNFSSPDTILIDLNKKHIIFVEFKNMSYFESEEDMKNWWKSKNRSVYLKITDSILGLSYYLKNSCSQSYDDFMNTSKSFLYVYKADTYKKKISKHLENKFSRYDFLFK